MTDPSIKEIGIFYLSVIIGWMVIGPEYRTTLGLAIAMLGSVYFGYSYNKSKREKREEERNIMRQASVVLNAVNAWESWLVEVPEGIPEEEILQYVKDNPDCMVSLEDNGCDLFEFVSAEYHED